MTPNVKRWDMVVRISVLLIIGCMVTGGGCSKPTGGLLTVEIAEKFLADNDSVDLSQFTSIEDAAAEALGKNRGGPLFLNGLTSLSDTAAEALAKHEGVGFNGGLYLIGLTSLSDTAAEALAKCDGYVGLDHDKLPPSASKILEDALATASTQQSNSSTSPSVSGGVLTVEIAEQYVAVNYFQRFVKLFTGSVDLSQFTSIEDAAAEVLAKHKFSLVLNGLTELSDAAAESLAKRGGILSLEGLTELSDAQADALAKHNGMLYLDGLTSLSDAQAEALAKQNGILVLDALTELSDAQAKALATHNGALHLNGLTSLSDVQAEALAKHDNGLELNGLTSLSDAAAESLVKSNGLHRFDHGKLPPSASKILKDAGY